MKDNEWVLTEKMASDLGEQIRRIKIMRESYANLTDYMRKVPISDMVSSKVTNTNAISNVTNNTNQPSIRMGDVYINGANNDTVKQHIEINRRLADEMLSHLGLRRSSIR